MQIFTLEFIIPLPEGSSLKYPSANELKPVMPPIAL